MKNIKITFKEFINESNHYDIDNNLKLLKNYYHILNNSDKEIHQMYKNYFQILYNFIIIERMFFDEVKLNNKEINKYLDLKPLKTPEEVYELFLELYDSRHKVRFGIETLDSIESVRLYIENNREKIYNTFI